MGLVAFRADRNALVNFSVVGHILVRINLLAVFGRYGLGPSGKVFEGAMTLETGIFLPGWSGGSFRFRWSVRRMKGRRCCRKKANEHKK
jgi:hypothetical protein